MAIGFGLEPLGVDVGLVVGAGLLVRSQPLRSAPAGVQQRRRRRRPHRLGVTGRPRLDQVIGVLSAVRLGDLGDGLAGSHQPLQRLQPGPITGHGAVRDLDLEFFVAPVRGGGQGELPGPARGLCLDWGKLQVLQLLQVGDGHPVAERPLLGSLG